MLKFSISYLNNGYNAEFVPRIRFVYQQKYVNCHYLARYVLPKLVKGAGDSHIKRIGCSSEIFKRK